jgi:hypothetical protein
LAAAENGIIVNKGLHTCKDYAIEELTHSRHDKLGAGVSESWHIIANTLQTQAM